jgi:abequosyltransferase
MSTLTIAIPTFNRANYLDQLLHSIFSQLSSLNDSERTSLNIIISDNNSSDCTPSIANKYKALHPHFKYIRNLSNLGWARNFAQCVELSTTKYLWLIGDDDLLMPSSLVHIFHTLKTKSFGALMVRPFGFNVDALSEVPKYCSGNLFEYYSPHQYLLKSSRYFTLTSCLILNIAAIPQVSPYEFIQTDLATFHLFLRCVLSSNSNLYLDRFMIASKRNNSSGYKFADVFVDQFFFILSSHLAYGLLPDTYESLQNKRIFSYYPYYATELRVSALPGELSSAKQLFESHFKHKLLYKLWLKPILFLPLPAAYLFGMITIFISRFRLAHISSSFSFASYYFCTLNNIMRTAK